MRKFDQLFLPVLLLSVFAIRAGNAIECYNCDSSQNAECSDVTKTSSLKPENCKPNTIGHNVGDWLKELTRIDFFETGEVSVAMVCQKITAKHDDKVVTFRGCQLDGGKTDVCDTLRSKAERSKQTIESCEICREDGCNKSTSLQLISLWLLFVPLIVLKAFA